MKVEMFGTIARAVRVADKTGFVLRREWKGERSDRIGWV